jgi:ABC-type glycerol-3-phosphate transport system substrate-binding protein
MAKYLAAKPGLPTRRSVYNIPDFRNNVPVKWYDLFAKQLEYAGARKPSPVWPTMSRAFQTALSEVISKSKTAERAVDDAGKIVMEEYNRLEGR